MFIKSRNKNNPVLIHIHDRPAFLNYFLIEEYKPELEVYFTVCCREQRDGGLSCTSEVSVKA